MKVILKENVPSLGKIGDVVEVKRGHYRNYLEPKKLAAEASSKNVKSFEHQKRLLSVRMEKGEVDAKNLAERIEALSLTLSRKAGEQDKLFGSVNDLDIEAALKEQGIDVGRKQIHLEEPIKALGVYQIPIKTHANVEAKLKVWVIKE